MDRTKNKNTNPISWIPSTWFAMGLPNLVLGGTLLSLLYKNMGFSDTQITVYTGIIILPWSFKPLWGPFMELYKTKKFYIYGAQILCGILFAIAAGLLFLSNFFDRDMPIKFLPIKFEKLRLKLEAARKAGYDKAITFEFSHFMSPQSAYIQAHHLFNRYQEYAKNL